jgi:hypothetical protein
MSKKNKNPEAPYGMKYFIAEHHEDLQAAAKNWEERWKDRQPELKAGRLLAEFLEKRKFRRK